MQRHAEVVVLGAGIAGLSTAYYLAKLGRGDVAVVEKGEVGCMASGANAAVITSMSSLWESRAMFALGKVNIDEYERFNEEWGRDLEFERCGYLPLIETESQLEERKASVEARLKMDVTGLRLVQREELLELEPNVAPDLFGAEFRTTDGHINVLYLMCALADKVREMGVHIHEHTQAVDIKAENGQVKSVITTNGEIGTKYIVNACGVAAPAIGKMVGIKIPIIANREQFLVTEEVQNLIRRPIISVSYYKDLDRAAATAETVAFAANPQKKGNLLIGGMNDFVGIDKRTTLRAYQAISKTAMRYLPVLKSQPVHIIRGYANYYVHTPDGQPILGKVDDLDGFIMAGGLNDYGMSVGAGVGKSIAELICFGESSIPLEGFRLSRFR